MTRDSAQKVETMAGFFDRRSDGYNQHMADNVADFAAFYQAVADQIPPLGTRVEILDLGCGTGLELKAIFHRTPRAQIIGVDLSAGMLSRLQETYQDRLEQISLLQGSYLDLDLGQNRFDICVSVMTLHHLLPGRKGNLYSRIRRALKPGGRYIEGDYVVSPDEERDALTAYQDVFDARSSADEGHFHFDIPLSKAHQLSLLQGAGFSAVEIVWEGEGAAVFVASRDRLQPSNK